MVHWEMLNVRIENVEFPAKYIEGIEMRRNQINIHVTDFDVGKIREVYEQFQRWARLCGTMHNNEVYQISIGKNHIEKKFLFQCDVSIGIPGVKATNLRITLTPLSDNVG